VRKGVLRLLKGMSLLEVKEKGRTRERLQRRGSEKGPRS